ncbi:hypothetical protein TUM4636_33790 [Shewanella glacialipiscicola]|nr:hypothetical protein [Shewanella glacialipiscicola]GIU20592.1 hypothetical protein TUM4636_33790 [Shewanella glacialipiscicola]
MLAYILMTLTESLTLMLALLYGVSQLWWSGRRFGAGLTLLLILTALLISSSPMLLLATLTAVGSLALLQQLRPGLLQSEPTT